MSSGLKTQLAVVVQATMSERGFTLLEIIIVVALIAGVYSFALPQFRIFSGLEISSTLNRLAVDIRSAWDVAVLTGKVHRLVFTVGGGDYWLEVADRNDVFLSVAGLDRDLTKEEEEEARFAFEENFKNYEDMMDNPLFDHDAEQEVVLLTPVTASKKRLQRVRWSMVKNLEWQKRTLLPLLSVQAMQAEHHVRKQSNEDDEGPVQAFLYFFPDGYVEAAVIQIAVMQDDTSVDRSVPPYTVRTNPYEGTAEVISGREEFDAES